MLKINTTSKYAEFKSDIKSDLYPLNEISYTVENESETVSFYNRFYNKIMTEQISNIQVNDVPVTRDNIQDLLSVLFASNEGGGGGGTVDLSNYYTKPETNTLLENKVDKVEGKQLSTEDYTTEEKAKLASLENYDDTAVKSDIAANAEAIETEVTRAKAAEKVNADAIIAVDAAYKAADTALHGNIDAEVTRATNAESALDTKIDTKVDKVEGKQLSTEDYTTEEKTKLASLENYDDTAVKDDIAANTAAIEAEVTRAKAAESTINKKIPTLQPNYLGNDKNFVFSEGKTGSTKNVISKVDVSSWEQGVYVRSYSWGNGSGLETSQIPCASTEKAGVMGNFDRINMNYLMGYEEITPNESGWMQLLDNKITQHTVITGNTIISLPSNLYNDIKELHLIFEGVTGSTITFPYNAVWKEAPTEIVEGATYEFIFTWIKSQNKWYAGYIKYE